MCRVVSCRVRLLCFALRFDRVDMIMICISDPVELGDR